ncbi:MAG: alpha/beta hydrolase [Xanthomonadales bacterium]|nr:alpha/beta hydrolase [Xanthomonadales bacterium]
MTSLVLLPGLDGTGELFADFVAALPADITTAVIAYPNSQLIDYAALEAFVRERLPERPFVLLAESFSGPIGLAIAAAPPPQLRGLVLCCTFAKLPFPFARWMRHLVRVAPMAMLPQSSLDVALLGGQASALLRARFAATLATVAPRVLQQRAQQALQIDVSARLQDIALPTLYLRGNRDRLIGGRAHRLLADGLPSLQTLSFDAPHFLLQVRPVEAAAAVSDFVRACTDR